MKSLSHFILFLTVLFFPILSGYTQQSILEVIGTAESNMKPLVNAKVTLYKDGSQVRSLYTSTNGEFKLEMDINSEYLIVIEKSGFLSKRIAFNTDLPNEVTGRWTMEFAMSLFPGCEGVNTSVLNDPVDRIKYSTNKSDFISDEAYVRNMRGRIDRLLLDIDKCEADNFQNCMDEGNRLMNEREFEAAATKFEEALAIFPDDRNAQRKLNEAETAAGESVLNERRYNAAVAQADRLVTYNDLEAARAKYNEALTYNPQSEYARTKVAELNQAITANQQAERERQETENKYTSLITQANAAYAAENFEAAKNFYEQALLVKPDSPIPRQKLTEIEPLIAAQKQERMRQEADQKAYLEALAMGENAFQANDLEAARQHYNRAAILKPDESFPRQKIAEIDRILDERRTANLQAEKAALRQKIEESHNEGDALLAQNNFEGAEAAYRRALQLDPNDQYARQQINKAKSLQITAAAQKQHAMEKAYTEAVSSGDQLLAAASFEQAIVAYKQALLQKPDDIMAKTKLAEAERKYAAEQQRLSDEQEKRRKYDQLLADGNTLLSSEKYMEAKKAYQFAVNLYPDQPYPRNKIQEIDRILAEQELLDVQYTRTIQEADNLLGQSKLAEAKAAYQRAVTIKPAEMYPQQQITKIDGMLAEQAGRENEQRVNEQYNTAISQADQLYNQNKLEEAKTAYQWALGFKPSETYPASQIAKIDARLAQVERERQERAAFEQRYNSIIATADKAYDQRDYPSAKTAYMEALKLKPGEKYPQERLNKIAEFDRILAVQEANRNVTTTSANQTASPRPSKLADLNFANDSERDKYLNGLRQQYPEGVTLEIHKEKTFTTNRYVVIRGDEVREFRMVRFSWGGVEYSLNGIPISGQYFETQIKPREGEFFQKFEY